MLEVPPLTVEQAPGSNIPKPTTDSTKSSSVTTRYRAGKVARCTVKSTSARVMPNTTPNSNTARTAFVCGRLDDVSVTTADDGMTGVCYVTGTAANG